MFFYYNNFIRGDIIKDLNRRKKFLLIYLAVSLLAIQSYDAKETYSYEILDEEEAYASYSKGLIYIGDKEYLDSLENINEYDILVEDNRDSKTNPDMIIHSSYKIYSHKLRTEILNVLCEYEKQNPSEWNRSLSSMELEWFAHNMCYIFDFKRDHTTDVDLDNNDEKKYDNKVLNKILGL